MRDVNELIPFFGIEPEFFTVRFHFICLYVYYFEIELS